MAGMYAYKMYGRFDDITANEFLALQLDTSEFRLSWDPSTAQCHVIKDLTEQDAKMPEDCQEKVPDSREMSHIYYWEVNWPRFFSNRDYVCGRRCKVYKDENGQEEAIVIFSKSTQHRNWPKKTKAHRVENYWSVLTIKPFTSGMFSFESNLNRQLATKIYIIICQSLSVRVSVRTLSPPTFVVRFEL